MVSSRRSGKEDLRAFFFSLTMAAEPPKKAKFKRKKYPLTGSVPVSQNIANLGVESNV